MVHCIRILAVQASGPKSGSLALMLKQGVAVCICDSSDGGRGQTQKEHWSLWWPTKPEKVQDLQLL